MLWIAEGKQSAEWDRTSQILAMTANVNNDFKANPKGYNPRDYHPYLIGRPKSKEEREDEAFRFHLEQIRNVPEDKFDETFDRFLQKVADGSRQSDQSGQSSD